MVAKSRARLLDEDAIAALRDRLLPLALIVTPNVPEAEALTGLTLTSVADLHRAAIRLVDMGARAALVKGGHLDGPAVDVLWDGTRAVELTAERIASRHTHGTGCTLSSAIAARLALGDDLVVRVPGRQGVRHARDRAGPRPGPRPRPAAAFPTRMNHEEMKQ